MSKIKYGRLGLYGADNIRSVTMTLHRFQRVKKLNFGQTTLYCRPRANVTANVTFACLTRVGDIENVMGRVRHMWHEVSRQPMTAWLSTTLLCLRHWKQLAAEVFHFRACPGASILKAGASTTIQDYTLRAY